jgi:hypothetical protein
MTKHHPTITLRSEEDIHHASLLRLGASLATVTGPDALQEEEILELHMELDGFDAVIEGLVQVRRVTLRLDGHHNSLLRIVRMRRRDQELLEEWYAQSHLGQTPSFTSARALDSRVHSHTTTSTMNLRGDGPPPPSQDVRISSIAHKRRGAGRAAIRSVLRASAAERDTTRARREHDQPSVELQLDGEIPSVEVRYTTTSWRRDWHDWLAHALLFVHTPPPHPALDAAVTVRLVYPPLLDLSCGGRVVNLHATGFGLSLDADPQAIASEVPGLETQAQAQAQAQDQDQAPPPEADDDEAFWTRMFGLGDEPEPLEAVLAVQPDPLEPLQGLDPDERRQLEAYLADRDPDLLATADRVAMLLGMADWYWPELNSLVKQADSPLDEAAAYLVLAAANRNRALDEIRAAAKAGTTVRVVAGHGDSCSSCRAHQDTDRTPLAQAHRGLPPFHLGCRCSLVRSAAAPRAP